MKEGDYTGVHEYACRIPHCAWSSDATWIYHSLYTCMQHCTHYSYSSILCCVYNIMYDKCNKVRWCVTSSECVLSSKLTPLCFYSYALHFMLDKTHKLRGSNN